MSSDGYSYRRRNNGRSIVRHNKTVDNQFVVPYCPQLLRIFNCHINVEVVSSVRSVKYLYKYVYKGHDAANITIEACYRILSKPLQCKCDSITRLSVYLPKEQSIVIEDLYHDVAKAAALYPTSTILAYFELNKNDHTARQFTYTQIPSHYVYK